MKQCLGQRIYSQNLLAAGLVGYESCWRKNLTPQPSSLVGKGKQIIPSPSRRGVGERFVSNRPIHWIAALGILTSVLQICLPSKANSLSPQAQPNNKTADSTQTELPELSVVFYPEVDTIQKAEFSLLRVGTQEKLSASSAESSIPNQDSELSVANAANLETDAESLTQQTSVSQLSDVQPTDWAYQALRSLMERYNVISGFADGTFKGNRPLSRYEFAAGLAATLDKVEGLIATAIGDEYIQEDIITLRRLQKEYRSALDDLQKRVNTTSDRTAFLQAHQFSTTTKLNGQLIFAPTTGSDAHSTIIARSRLNLNTSFNKKDLLVSQLESGNNGGDAIGLAQKENSNRLANSGFIGNFGGLDYNERDQKLNLRRLYYSFRPSEDLAVTVGAKMSPRDFIDRNRYANNEAIDFSSSFFINNPLIVQNQIDRDGGAGAAIAWKAKGSKISVRSLYIAANANNSGRGGETQASNGGLFGDPHQASVEVEYSPNSRFAFRLQYTNAEINNTDINAFGVNAEYTFNRNLGIFTRLGVGNYQGFNTAINQNIDLHPLSWAIGVGVRNFVLPGTTIGVAVGQPFIADNFGNATQTNFEAFYNLQLSDNISVTPILSLVSNPNNDSSNGTIWQSTLRTVFSF